MNFIKNNWKMLLAGAAISVLAVWGWNNYVAPRISPKATA